MFYDSARTPPSSHAPLQSPPTTLPHPPPPPSFPPPPFVAESSPTLRHPLSIFPSPSLSSPVSLRSSPRARVPLFASKISRPGGHPVLRPAPLTSFSPQTPSLSSLSPSSLPISFPSFHFNAVHTKLHSTHPMPTPSPTPCISPRPQSVSIEYRCHEET